MSSQSQAHLTLYNEERKQEGDFWYHLFFCDSNKAAVSQLGKYTVIIVYYSNCIMQKQMIFFPEKKNLFSLWLCFLPPQKYRIRNFHLKSEGFPCPWPVEAAWSQLSRRMPVSTSVSDANCAPRPAHFTTLPSSLSVSLAWLCLPPWAPTMWNTPLLDQCSSVCERIWELGERGSPWDNPRAEPVGRRKENHVPLFAENNFASAQHYLNLWSDCFSPIFDIAYENVKAKKKKDLFYYPLSDARFFAFLSPITLISQIYHFLLLCSVVMPLGDFSTMVIDIKSLPWSVIQVTIITSAKGRKIAISRASLKKLAIPGMCVCVGGWWWRVLRGSPCLSTALTSNQVYLSEQENAELRNPGEAWSNSALTSQPDT